MLYLTFFITFDYRFELITTSVSYCMVCVYVWEDNPRALVTDKSKSKKGLKKGIQYQRNLPYLT